jgi:hypothetical protein
MHLILKKSRDTSQKMGIWHLSFFIEKPNLSFHQTIAKIRLSPKSDSHPISPIGTHQNRETFDEITGPWA